VIEDRGFRVAYPRWRWWVLDGGYDAPLDREGRRRWHIAVGIAVILGIVAIAIFR
jgi:hypothetical protein